MMLAPLISLEMIPAFMVAMALVPTGLIALDTAEIPVVPMTVTGDRLPEPQSQLPDVIVRPDIACSILPGFRPLRLEVHAPAASSARPLIIFVYGGGWTIGTKCAERNLGDWHLVLADFARSVYVMASVEYRLSGEAPYPSAAIDVKDAIRFPRSNAGHYGIDPDRVSIWGGSAGAYLAEMAATNCSDPAFLSSDPVLKDVSDYMPAFVGWYGLSDIS